MNCPNTWNLLAPITFRTPASLNRLNTLPMERLAKLIQEMIRINPPIMISIHSLGDNMLLLSWLSDNSILLPADFKLGLVPISRDIFCASCAGSADSSSMKYVAKPGSYQ